MILDGSKLEIYAPDNGGNDTKFRMLDLSDIQRNFYHVVEINSENDGFRYVADVSVADYIQDVLDEQAAVLITTYKTNDSSDIEALQWQFDE